MRKFEVGDRKIYSAIYKGCTLDPLIENRLIKTQKIPLVLLENIALDGQSVSDHNWYPYWGAFELSSVYPGDEIQFLATPTHYLKSNEERQWWQIGLSQLCWVQSKKQSFEASPAISPPESKEEAEWFLSRRMRIAIGESQANSRRWGVRVGWNEKSLSFINKLIDVGWSKFGNFYPYQIEAASIFEKMEEQYSDREISRIADIAAWCNAGFPAWESRAETLKFQPSTMWQMCSAREFLDV